ncbi:MAG: hypothetical protein GF384_09065, partial [Elusimicrobia bacterium]|nr:hypothetical protein [Elusimicrobiota bacterium]MBD3412735.1 hypothetical protein [Elusimicrobiota bacterium]
MILIRLLHGERFVMLSLGWVRAGIVFFLISASLISCYTLPQTGSIPDGPLSGKRVMLDPGHGVKNSAGIIINPGMIG